MVVVGAAVFAIAAVAIGREARRLGTELHLPTYRLEEAVQYVADRLPDEQQARLTHDDVRQLLLWHLDFLRQVQDELGTIDAEAAVVSDDPGFVAVATRAAEQLEDVELEDVQHVMGLQLDYLRELGAISEADE